MGVLLANSGSITIYGGGSIGLMGALAESVLSNNGTIIGIIPQFMIDLEWGNPKVDLMVVSTMAERKQKLMEGSDAIVALPGGTGTLEELAEAVSLKKLGLYSNPIIIVNTNGFYDPLIQLFNRMANDRFMRHEHLKMFEVIREPAELFESIEKAEFWGDKAKTLASL